MPSLFELNTQDDRVDEILILLGGQYDIIEPGLLKPVLAMLTMFLPSPEVIFSTACDILDRQDWFISHNAAKHRMKLYSFRLLVVNFLPKYAEDLLKIDAFDENFLNFIFVDFFCSLLPIPEAAKIFDAFLLEGYKVLFRFGLALIFLCKTFIGTCKTGIEFWNYVRQQCLNNEITWARLCLTAYTSGKSSLIDKLSSKSISLTRATILHYELEAKLALGEKLRGPLNLNFRNLFQMKNPSMAEDFAIESKILDSKTSERLRMFLPSVNVLEGFKLVFSTTNDGWNLSTLYAKAENLNPCILLVRTLQTSSVVGVFITSAISPPSESIRGDGNCFVCRLDGPEAACYRWIGKKILTSSQTHNRGNKTATKDQFAIFSESHIMIGGSADYGENALFIDSELSSCHFGVSDTFGNPQLASNGVNGRAATIADIELFCGTRSVNIEMSDTGNYSKRVWKSEQCSYKDSTRKKESESSTIEYSDQNSVDVMTIYEDITSENYKILLTDDDIIDYDDYQEVITLAENEV